MHFELLGFSCTLILFRTFKLVKFVIMIETRSGAIPAFQIVACGSLTYRKIILFLLHFLTLLHYS